jgi:hypothetical protein
MGTPGPTFRFNLFLMRCVLVGQVIYGLRPDERDIDFFGRRKGRVEEEGGGRRGPLSR